MLKYELVYFVDLPARKEKEVQTINEWSIYRDVVVFTWKQKMISR